MSFRAPSLQRPKRRTYLNLELLEDRTVPTLLGQQLYPSDNPWNQRITDAPVAANSAAVMNNIITNYGNNRLHPDFGQDYHANQALYGIPFNIVHGNTVPHVSVVIDAYPDESDLIAAPIPAGAVIEGDWQNAPRVGLNNRGDSHLLVWDVDNNIAYEFFRASRPSENGDGKWHADQETVWDMKTNNFRTLGWTSADAAGLSILAGLVRPDEALPVSQGGQGVINHAIRFTLQNSIILDKFQYPASHTANGGNNNPAIMPPMGARFRLKAGVDIAQMNPQSRIVAQAMKDYGMIVADNGSNFFFQGASSSVNASNQLTLTWDDDDVQDTVHGLKSLRYADFELVDLTPVVTNLDVHSGGQGTTVTVIGKNFSGAAGRLQVFFGSTPATSVTVLDDGHVRAVAPAGSGTVDVRVRSGVTTSNSDSVPAGLFGYGFSVANANDRFTFGSGPVDPPVDPPANTAPTLVVAAAAAPAFVTGKTAGLSVLGTDDGGAANLKYTWSTVSKPANVSAPAFQHNGTNAAKANVAWFSGAGSYTFLVTLADVQGLTATSMVTVTVVQKLTAVRIAPAIVQVVAGRSVKLWATAYDQFNVAMTQQPRFTWKDSGPGRVTAAGRYFAPRQAGARVTVSAWVGLFKGAARVNVRRLAPT